MEREIFERKSYLGTLRMDQARTKVKIKTKMLKYVKLNFKNYSKNLKKLCEHIDSQEHILWCEGYEKGREDEDLSRDYDLTKYFQQVLQLREKNEN